MASFQKLWRERFQVKEEYIKLKNAAGFSAVFEYESCVCIQRNFRGYRVRNRLCILASAATEIQRIARGHKGRLVASNRKQEVEILHQSGIYHCLATIIQRAFRGFYSRKYKSNFYDRKKYLGGIVANGEKLRAKALEHYIKSKEEDERIEREETYREFKNLTENLHHLLSTKQQPGIFNPLNSEFDLPIPTIDNIPVEDHIARGVKDLLRKRKNFSAYKEKIVKDFNNVNKLPQDLSNRISVQASSPYDACKLAEQQDARLSKLKFTSNKDFQTTFKSSKKPKYQIGNNVNQPYIEGHRNPYLVRGIPSSQKELDDAVSGAGTLSFNKYPNKPYYTAVGGNKSSTLPNGIFEVIKEAEHYGGVTKKHLGLKYTKRYGIPDTCDDRPPSDLLLPEKINNENNQNDSPSSKIDIDNLNSTGAISAFNTMELLMQQTTNGEETLELEGVCSVQGESDTITGSNSALMKQSNLKASTTAPSVQQSVQSSISAA